MTDYKFGLDTFGDMTLDDQGRPVSAGQVLRMLFPRLCWQTNSGWMPQYGEHHRDDFAVTSPETVLAGIATVTKIFSWGPVLQSCLPRIRFGFIKPLRQSMLYQMVVQQ